MQRRSKVMSHSNQGNSLSWKLTIQLRQLRRVRGLPFLNSKKKKILFKKMKVTRFKCDGTYDFNCIFLTTCQEGSSLSLDAKRENGLKVCHHLGGLSKSRGKGLKRQNSPRTSMAVRMTCFNCWTLPWIYAPADAVSHLLLDQSSPQFGTNSYIEIEIEPNYKIHPVIWLPFQ